MNIIEAIILGIIQGITEFIPISSTAHLTIAGNMMGLLDPSNPEKWTAYIAIIQLGTLAAVLFYFFYDLKAIPIPFLKENISKNRLKIREQSNNAKMGWLIILGSIPVFTVGFALKKFIEGSLTKELSVIAMSLIILALILFWAEKVAKLKKDIKKISITDSIIIGLAQCLALIPGSSRSGTTITAGLFLGLNREAAARFSFLLSVPAVLISGLYELYKSLPHISSNDILVLSISSIIAGITGYLSITFLINYLKKRSTMLFIIYRIMLGLTLIAFIYFGIVR